MRRLLISVGVTVVAVAILTPLSVLATVAMGIPARHWSGVHLNDIRWDGDGDAGTEPPAGTPSNSPYDPDKVVEIADHLGAFNPDPATHTGAVSEGPDGRHGCVSVIVVRLDNAMFSRLGRDRDQVCVVYSPDEAKLGFGPGTNPPTPPAQLPRPETYWSWSALLGSLWVLLTGFPLHIGATLLLAALVWTVLLVIRRRPSTATRS